MCLILSLFALILYYLINQTNIILNKSNLEQGECVLDEGFTLTKTINKLFIKNKIYNKVSKILVSIALDLTFIISLISWCLLDKLCSNSLIIIFFIFVLELYKVLFQNMKVGNGKIAIFLQYVQSE